MNDSKPIGAISKELIEKEDYTTSAHEQGEQMLKEYEKNFEECATRGTKQFNNQPFYITIHTQRNKLMPNVLTLKWIPRLSCPLPTYAQTIYSYDPTTQKHKLLWTIPDEASCAFIKDRVLELPGDQKELINYVLDFYDGKLDKLSDTLNSKQN